MLPFLEPKKVTSVIISKRGKSDLEAAPEMPAPGQESHPLREVAEDLLRALDHKSVIDIAHALQALCETYEAGEEEQEEQAD